MIELGGLRGLGSSGACVCVMGSVFLQRERGAGGRGGCWDRSRGGDGKQTKSTTSWTINNALHIHGSFAFYSFGPLVFLAPFPLYPTIKNEFAPLEETFNIDNPYAYRRLKSLRPGLSAFRSFSFSTRKSKTWETAAQGGEWIHLRCNCNDTNPSLDYRTAPQLLFPARQSPGSALHLPPPPHQNILYSAPHHAS